MARKRRQTNAIAEAILNYWGEPCADFDPNCACCQAWEQYRNLKSAEITTDELIRLKSLIADNVTTYADRISALWHERKAERKYVQERAEKACRYIDQGSTFLAKAFLYPLTTGDYYVKNTPDSQAGNDSGAHTRTD